MNPTKTNTPTKTELSQLCNQTKTRNREKFDFRPILNGAAYFRRHLLENDETVILDIFTWPVIFYQPPLKDVFGFKVLTTCSGCFSRT
ncbi:MAG: hypothetical protein ACK51L_03815 [bacterium]